MRRGLEVLFPLPDRVPTCLVSALRTSPIRSGWLFALLPLSCGEAVYSRSPIEGVGGQTAEFMGAGEQGPGATPTNSSFVPPLIDVSEGTEGPSLCDLLAEHGATTCEPSLGVDPVGKRHPKVDYCVPVPPEEMCVVYDKAPDWLVQLLWYGPHTVVTIRTAEGPPDSCCYTAQSFNVGP